MARGYEEGKVQGSTWEDESHTTQQHQQASHSNQDRLRQAALKRIGQEFSPGHRPHGRPDMMRTHDGSPSWRDKRPASMTVEHGGADMQMGHFSAEEIANMRKAQENNLRQLKDAASVAFQRFQSILITRELKIPIALGLRKAAGKELQSWILKKLGTTIAQSVKITSEIGNVLENQIKSDQAGGKLSAIEIVSTSMAANIQAIRDAETRVKDASELEIVTNHAKGLSRNIEVSESDIQKLVMRLDAVLVDQIYRSGTQTVNEYLDGLRQRQKSLPDELDKAGTIIPAPR